MARNMGSKTGKRKANSTGSTDTPHPMSGIVSKDQQALASSKIHTKSKNSKKQK